MIIKIILIILIFLIASTSTTENLQWRDNSFAKDCKERQHTPVVEYYEQNEMQYLFFSQRVTWEEARLLCRSYNSRLAALDTMEKALGIAKTLAKSNIVMEDTWLGGRRIDFVWYWIEFGNNKNVIPMESNIEDYPPWTRAPIRPTKECLAIDRRSHQNPNFIDLDCRLQRPFICEKKSGDLMSNPVPSKWVQINKHTYTLYNGKVTWEEAAMFCRTKGARLAIPKSSIIVSILVNSMTKTRPDFETVWVGAHFSYGQWVWMSTGSVLNSLTDKNGYPPWRYGRSLQNDGCLLLDRHIEDNSSFIEMPCDRKRDFVCEEYTNDDENDWMDEPVKFSYGNSTYIIYAIHKTWMESRTFCSERGSVLAYVDHMDTINLIIEAMGDHPREISHVWLGGNYNEKFDEWRWIGNNQRINKERDEFGYPPWTNIEGDDVGTDTERSLCLNLDRSDHVKAHFYGLDCSSKQSFICKITCDTPPPIKNGTWNCIDITGGQQCILQCDQGLIMRGVQNFTCSFKNGWIAGKEFTEFPLCLKPKDYATEIIRALSQDIQRSSGYYFLIDHSSVAIKSMAMKFAEKVLTAFPLSNNLRGGMTSYITDPPLYLPFNQNNTCTVISLVRNLKNNIADNITVKANTSRISKDISLYNGRRITIIAMIDSQRGLNYVDSLLGFKAAGHHIIIFGLSTDWEILLPLATIGYDNRINLLLLDGPEFKNIDNELEHGRKSVCLNHTINSANFTSKSTTSRTTLTTAKIINRIDEIERKNSVIATTTTEVPMDSDYADEQVD